MMTDQERIIRLGGTADETYERVAEWACEIADRKFEEGRDARDPNWNRFATPQELEYIKADPFAYSELFELDLIREKGYTAYRGKAVRRSWVLRCCTINLNNYGTYTVDNVVDCIFPDGMEFLDFENALKFAEVVEAEAQARGY